MRRLLGILMGCIALLLCGCAAKDDFDYAPILEYPLTYELNVPGAQLSYAYLWDGFDPDNKFGPSLSAEERLYTYRTEYAQKEDAYYLVYLKQSVITSLLPWLSEYASTHSADAANYHFSDHDAQTVIDGKYLFAYQNKADKQDGEVLCRTVSDWQSAPYTDKGYQLVFCAQRKKAVIRQNVSQKRALDKEISLYMRVALQYTDGLTVYTFTNAEQANQKRSQDLFDYVGERLESYPLSYEQGDCYYIPQLGMQNRMLKTRRAEIVHENDKTYISLPRYIHTDGDPIDLLAPETDFTLDEDVFGRHKSAFSAAYVKEHTTIGNYVFGLYDYQQVAEMIQ